MADEDDDFLDLCEDSSPLPDHNIRCGDTKSLDASVKCTTVLSSDLEPAELENYSDFESDDSSSNVSIKKDSVVFEEKSVVKSRSSQQKDNKLVIGSCGKPQIVSLKLDEHDDDEISDDCILSFYPQKNSSSSSNKRVLDKTNQPKSTSKISADSYHIISDESDCENVNKNVNDTKSNGVTGINSKTDNGMEELWHKRKTDNNDCREKGLLFLFRSGSNKRKELDTRCNQWISMSHWHTEKDTQSKNSVKRKQSEDDGGVQNSDISPLKKEKLIHTDGELSSLNTHINSPVVERDKIRTFVSDYLNKVQLELQPPPPMPRIPDERKYVYERNDTRRDNQKKIESHTGTHNVQTVITKAAIKVKEMFPHLTAREIGVKLKAINNGIMTKEELIQGVVEEICSAEESTGDVQIAMAKPKIQTQQHVHHAKNFMINSAKGKSLMKKVNVVHGAESMDVDMECQEDDSHYDFTDASVTRLEAKKIEPTKVKLQWAHAPFFVINEKNLRYVVEMQAPPATEWTTVAKEVAGTVYLVSNLDSTHDYRFRVRARTLYGKVFDPSPIASVYRTIIAASDIKSCQIKVHVTPKLFAEETTQEEVSSSTITCEGCQSNTTFDKMVQCCDGHLNCNLCVEKVVKKVLSHGNEETNVTCCYNNWFECNSYIPESQTKKVLPKMVFELLEDKLNKKASETIDKMTDLYSCPSCQYKVVIEGDLKKFHCPQCNKATCRYCGKIWDDTSNHSVCTLNTFMASSDSDVTSTWCTFPEGHKDFVAVELGEDTPSEKSFVLSLFYKESFSRKGNHQTPVSKIFRIQNPRLWQKYSLSKEHMIEDIGKDSINEQHLFHGTASRAVGGICREGLDWRMCGENGTAFGQGTYFAKNSSYSLRYSNAPGRSLYGGGLGIIRRARNVISGSGFLLGSGISLSSIAAIRQPQNVFNFGQQNVNTSFQNQGLTPVCNVHTVNNNNTQQQIDPSLLNQSFPFGVPPSSNANTSTINNNTQQPHVFYFGANPVPTNSNVSNVTNNNAPPSFGVGFGQTNSQLSNASLMSYYSMRNSRNLNQAPDESGAYCNETSAEEQFINGEKKYMFLARVLVGRSCLGISGMRKPPRDEQNRPYNSACDNEMNPSIHVIFDSAQCYPEYLIELG